MLTAALRGIPTMLLEQNAVPGLTNRLLARVVSAAAVNFDTTVSFFGRRAFVAGNPIRQEFFSATARDVATAGSSGGTPPRVLIFGGSQGAHAINMAMVAAAPRLAEGGGGVAFTHQTGERDLERVRDGYRQAGFVARVEPFLYEMDREMTDADLIVSPRRGDHAGRADRRRQAVGADPAADRGRRPSAQERRGAAAGRRRGGHRAEGLVGRRCWRSGSSRW